MSTKINYEQWITLHEMVRGNGGHSEYRFDKMDYWDDFEMYRVHGSIKLVDGPSGIYFSIRDDHEDMEWFVREYGPMTDMCRVFLRKVYKVWSVVNPDRVKKLNYLLGKTKEMD